MLVIKLTGTITDNIIVTIPDTIEKTYTIINGTLLELLPYNLKQHQEQALLSLPLMELNFYMQMELM
jgi:hypothetical protein